jgi:hypothetical protein
MRTKTLLLTAAALLAAGITSTQAQPVYSQNVVGYASVATPGAGVNYLITVPFAIGVSNGANEIWPLISPGNPSIPDGSLILIWNSATLTYTTYQSDSGSPTLWDDAGGNFLPFSPTLPVGQGFFLSPASPVTNTFAGTVAVNVGTSNVMVLKNAGVNYLVAPAVPYAGAVTNGTLATGAGGPCLFSPDGVKGLPDGSLLLIWNPLTLKYTTYQSDSQSGSFWDDAGGNALPAPPSITVGQGFFLSPANANYNWTVGL